MSLKIAPTCCLERVSRLQLRKERTQGRFGAEFPERTQPLEFAGQNIREERTAQRSAGLPTVFNTSRPGFCLDTLVLSKKSEIQDMKGSNYFQVT